MGGIEGSADPVPLPNANVALTKGGDIFPLTYNPSTSRYELSDNTFLTIIPGDMFTIQVEANDRTASATTVVPPPPEGLQISNTTIRIPQLNLGFGLAEQIRELFASARLELSWENTDENYYYVVIERRTDRIDPILPTELPDQVIDLLSSFRFISEPSNGSSFEIVGVALETYGLHVAKVYRVNPEYVRLFQNPRQDSRDLNEPATNITNGVGIFSAFAADSVFFEVTR